MPLSFLEFLVQLKNNPALLGTVLLTLAVLLVNGWTDAPNAIAGVVVTGALPFRSAVTLAAVCNLLGVLCVTSVNASVAETVYSIASFSGGPKAALTALCAAMTAIVLWAGLAGCLGFPPARAMPWWLESPAQQLHWRARLLVSAGTAGLRCGWGLFCPLPPASGRDGPLLSI